MFEVMLNVLAGIGLASVVGAFTLVALAWLNRIPGDEEWVDEEWERRE